VTENVIEFSDRNTLEQKAGAWLIRLDSDTPLTPEEQHELRAWYARSPAHREELKSLAAFWGKMNLLTELAVPLGTHEARHKRRGARNNLWARVWSLGGAASLAAVATFVALGVWLVRDPLVNTNGIYSTAVGQQQTVTLADGSVVQLNTNTRLQVTYGGDYRDVRLLQGEAYFTVAKNPERPFRVHAGKGRVQAVGTAFSVYLKPKGIDVVVTEGRVALARLLERDRAAPIGADPAPEPPSPTTAAVENNPDEPLLTARELGVLDAGQGASIQLVDADSNADTIPDKNKSAGEALTPPDRQSRQNIVRPIDAKKFSQQLAWRNGLLIFAGEPLEQVVHEISRYTTLTIEITDPEVKAIKIGGQFRVGDTQAMLASLQTNFRLRVKRVGENRLQIAAAD
jgi:transmembrane sensor